MRHAARLPLVTLAVAATSALAACVARPTEIETTWRDPSADVRSLRRVAAALVGAEPDLRRQVEDRLARDLDRVVASHTLIPEVQPADTQQIRERLTAAGVDGAVVLRLVEVQQRTGRDTGAIVTPLSTAGRDSATGTGAAGGAGGLWESFHLSPLRAFEPGRQTVLTMDLRLYSVPEGRLLWAGRSRSFNPASVNELVGMISDAAIQELRRQRLL